MTAKELLKKYVEDYLWSVIPVGEDKRPIASWKDSQEKALSVAEFDAVIARNSTKKTSGMGLVTGKISGITVVDFDEGSEDLFKDIRTPTVRTGGGGKHYYFKYTPRISQGVNTTLHIDIRNDGGYAILPPSVSTKGIYSWIISPDESFLAELPDWFVEMYQSQVVEHHWSFEGATEGNRNDTSVSVAGSLINSMPNNLDLAYTAFETWNTRNDPPIEVEQLKATFEWCVNKHGENHPPVTPSSVASAFEGAKFPEESCIPTGYEWFDSASGGIHAGSLTVVSAQTGVGKSLVLLNMIDHVLRNSNRRVTYLDLENGRVETLERLWRIRFGKTKLEWLEAIKNKAQTMLQLNEAFGDKLSLFFRENNIRQLETLMKTLREECQRGTSIFIVDPLQKITGGSDIEQQAEIVGQLSDFAQQTGVAILLCHHVRKPATAGGRYVGNMDDISEIKYLDPSIEDVKGGSVITDTAEVVWAMTRSFAATEDNAREQDLARAKTKLKVLKCRNNGKALGVYSFFLDIDTLQVKANMEELSFYGSNMFNDGGWKNV